MHFPSYAEASADGNEVLEWCNSDGPQPKGLCLGYINPHFPSDLDI